MGYPPERGRLSTRYSPVRHFTRPANRAFSCDLHVLGMPPALILSQDQTLQFYLEFSRTRTHYLVFKEQVFLIRIVTISAPVSRGLFLLLASNPPTGNCFCNPIWLPCQPLGADFFPPRRANHAAFQATVIYIQSPPPCQAPLPTFFTWPKPAQVLAGKTSVGCVLRTISSAHPRDRRYFSTQSPDHVRRGGNPLTTSSGFQKTGRESTALPAPMFNQ